MKHYDEAATLTNLRLASADQRLHPGFQLKDERIYQKLTLSELADNICTVSTLSRIEKGDLSPNPNQLQKLCEKLQISIQTDLTQNTWLLPFRLSLYQFQFNQLRNLNEKTSFHYQNYLIQFRLSVIKHDLDESEKQHLILQKYITLMSAEELQFYFVILGNYYTQLNNGFLAKKYYSLSLKIAQQLSIKDPFLFLSLAHYYSTSGNSLKTIHYAIEAESIFSHYYATKHIIDTEFLLCYEYMRQGLLKKSIQLLSKLKTQLNHHDLYKQSVHLYILYGHYYRIQKNISRAELLYFQALIVTKHSPEAILALIELYYESNQIEKLQKLLKQLHQSNFNFTLQKHTKLHYYDLLLKHSTSNAFRIFLIKNAIPYAKQKHDSDALQMYATSLIHFYKKTSKYKEALSISLQLLETQISFKSLG